jgi:hypothetical protein
VVTIYCGFGIRVVIAGCRSLNHPLISGFSLGQPLVNKEMALHRIDIGPSTKNQGPHGIYRDEDWNGITLSQTALFDRRGGRV